MSYIKRSKKNGKVYLSEVETKRIGGKVVTKHIRYIGRETDGTAVINICISDLSVEQIKVYGHLLVLHHLAEEINLPTLLGKYGHEIMSMVYAHCLNFESVNQMPNWFERTDLNFLLKLSLLDIFHGLIIFFQELCGCFPFIMIDKLPINSSTRSRILIMSRRK